MSVKVEHRIGVKAPAAVVWEVIADLPGWAEWNPLYPKAEGVIRIGAPLTLDVVLPGHKPETIRPVVIDWVPDDQLHLRMAYGGGLVRTIRYLEIEKMSEDGCIFSNGELYLGFVGGFVGKRMRKPLRAGFTAMGEALAARAEAIWNERAASAK